MAESQNWDQYWKNASQSKGIYAAIAKFYRKYIISPALAYYLRKYFKDQPGNVYLHAGCGSAESDCRISAENPVFIMFDSSIEALKLAKKLTSFSKVYYVCGDIFAPPFKTESIDGIWNLGVMEHFETKDLLRILKNFHRLLKKEGKLVLLWPPEFGLSVIVLTSFLFFVNKILRKDLSLYPDEVSRYRSKRWVENLSAPCGINIQKTHFGPRDLFTYVTVIGTKN